MDLPYFYEENIQQQEFFLSEETSRHCIQVLRMQEGAYIQLTDGIGNLFTSTIIQADKKKSKVHIDTKFLIPKKRNNVSIAISLLKNTSRLEWFMEKATEIGVSEIIPLICEHTEKENFRYDRMNNILISAMLQSKQTWLPHLHQPKNFQTLISKEFDGAKFVAHCVEEKKISLAELNDQNKNKLILIGPEGDFSSTEIQLALQNNFIPVSLGSTRLRSETAGLVSVTLLTNGVHHR